MQINKRKIGNGSPVYIIAEMSANHGQDFKQAEELVREAAKAGADALKLQTYTADTLTLNSDREPFQIKGTLWEGKTLYELYQEAYTPWDWQPRLKALAEKLGMACFSSPFDESSVEFLETMDVPAYKIASFELVDLPLIERCAQTGKPLIISTGMATEEEIRDAVDCARGSGCKDLALLKCSSAYPSPPEAMNLKTIPALAEKFDVVAGLSDHTHGISAPLAAVALGAKIIEKHICLSRNELGPDTAFSLEPAEFKEMVEAVRFTEKALGNVSMGPSEAEVPSRAFRRSLFVCQDVQAGDIVSSENVRSVRPADGLAPKHYLEVLGRKFRSNHSLGQPLQWDMLKE